MASPVPYGIRYREIERKTKDEWLFGYSPSSEDFMFDIGAAIGEEVLVLSKMARHVSAVDAHPNTFAWLSETIRRSGITNATAIHCALADQDGELFISSRDANIAKTVMTNTGTKVPARTLQSICSEFSIPKVDFLKMNIEGAEKLAIRGFGETPIRHLVISCHDFIEGDDFYRTQAEVRRFLESAGYLVSTRPNHPDVWVRCNVYAERT